MKKNNLKYLSLIGLFVICGCEKIPSSSQTLTLDLDETIASLKQGVKLSVEVNETYNEETKIAYLQNTVKGKEFSFVQYKDETRENIALHEYYTNKDNDNYVYSTRLDVSNTYNYYSLYNPLTSEKYTWDDGYNNPFEKLDKTCFIKESNTSYRLSDDAVTLSSTSMTTLLYGNPGLELTSLSLSLDKKGYHIYSEAQFEGNSGTYEYIFNVEVLSIGENVDIDYRLPPFEEKSDDTAFNEMISSLRSNNYTAEVYVNDGFDETTSYVYSNEDKLYYETGAYKVGFYTNEDGTMQEVTKDGDDFYKVGSAFTKEELEISRPSFNLSRACFSLQEDNSYILKDGVEGSMDVVTFIEGAADYDLDTFIISKTNEGYIFKNTYPSGDEVIVTFTNIGSTNVGFTKDSVLEPKQEVTWSDLLDAESYAYLVSASSVEEANNIPVPEGYTTSIWIQLSEEEGSSILIAEPSANLDDDFWSYSLQLSAAGFEISDEPGENGGVLATKTIVKDGSNCTLFIEFLEYEDYFCIMTYFE